MKTAGTETGARSFEYRRIGFELKELARNKIGTFFPGSASKKVQGKEEQDRAGRRAEATPRAQKVRQARLRTGSSWQRVLAAAKIKPKENY
jgi:hypothetical protein